MLKTEFYKSEKLVEAILDESGMNTASIQLIKIIIQKQQETIMALERISKTEDQWRQYIHVKFDELWKKVDPSKFSECKKNEPCMDPEIPLKA